MTHFASPAFWALYNALPAEVRALADKNYVLLTNDPRHPSLHFKRIGSLWSVRVGARHRALGVEVEGGIVWLWIGTHAEYDRIVGGSARMFALAESLGGVFRKKLREYLEIVESKL